MKVVQWGLVPLIITDLENQVQKKKLSMCQSIKTLLNSNNRPLQVISFIMHQTLSKTKRRAKKRNKKNNKINLSWLKKREIKVCHPHHLQNKKYRITKFLLKQWSQRLKNNNRQVKLKKKSLYKLQRLRIKRVIKLQKNKNKKHNSLKNKSLSKQRNLNKRQRSNKRKQQWWTNTHC